MSRRRTTLACVAPLAYLRPLTLGLDAVGFSVRFFRRPESDSASPTTSRRDDPYDLTRIAERMRGKADGILLVAPRRRSPRRVAPSSVVGDLPVGLLFSDRPLDLTPWIRALQDDRKGPPTWAVLSMNRKDYLWRGRLFAHWLRGTKRSGVKTWLGDATTRYELCEHLAQGPRLVVYFGHGRARGLSGYFGLRWHHVSDTAQAAPIGTFFCFACNTLKHERGQPPFGRRLVMEGRAVAYFGSVDAVSTGANSSLAQVFGSVFKLGQADNIGTLLKLVRRQIHADSSYKSALEAFQTYRVIGNPLHRLIN